MADTTFVNGVSVSDADWFNDENRLLYTILGDPANAIAAYQNIQGTKAAFIATVSAPILNVTGDGTAYDIVFDTEALDRGAGHAAASGIFTAPTTGYYRLSAVVHLLGLAAGHTLANIAITVSAGGSHYIFYGNPAVIRDATGNELVVSSSFLVSMAATATASVTVVISNSTKVVDIGTGSKFMGELAF